MAPQWSEEDEELVVVVWLSSTLTSEDGFTTVTGPLTPGTVDVLAGAGGTVELDVPSTCVVVVDAGDVGVTRVVGTGGVVVVPAGGTAGLGASVVVVALGARATGRRWARVTGRRWARVVVVSLGARVVVVVGRALAADNLGARVTLGV
jgi:hypothetical protein